MHEMPFLQEISVQKAALATEKERSTPEEQERQARTLALQGDYEAILGTFALPEHQGLLEGQIARVKKETARSRLKDAAAHLLEGDWEMLTVLELFDRATFDHSLRTYALAHEKIKSAGPVGDYLRQHIEAEGLTPWDIELACLLHDMGKVSLQPKELLLNNPLHNADWHRLFEQFCHDSLPDDEAAEKIAAYEQSLVENPAFREKDITPLFLGLSAEEQTELTTLGIDIEQPLGVILATHQDVSAAIADRVHPGSPVLELIGNHHEKPLASDEAHPVAHSAVRISSIVGALRLADVFDAYRSARAYKAEEAVFSTHAYLIKKTTEGFVDPELTRLWIKDDLKRFDAKGYLNSLKKRKSKYSDVEAKSYATVRTFLDQPQAA